MRRHPPESRQSAGSPGPLWDAAPVSVRVARDQGHAAADAAAARASRIDPAWHGDALDAVKRYAETHPGPFLFEHIRFALPDGADRRALGHVAKEAQRAGWIEPSGYAPAVSSNGAPKCTWRSLIYRVDLP